MIVDRLIAPVAIIITPSDRAPESLFLISRLSSLLKIASSEPPKKLLLLWNKKYFNWIELFLWRFSSFQLFFLNCFFSSTGLTICFFYLSLTEEGRRGKMRCREIRHGSIIFNWILSFSLSFIIIQPSLLSSSHWVTHMEIILMCCGCDGGQHGERESERSKISQFMKFLYLEVLCLWNFDWHCLLRPFEETMKENFFV